MPSRPVVAITGASAGIGRATALRLAHDGASVVVSARRGDRLDALVRDITGLNGQAMAVVADVTHEEAMQQLVRRSIERFGRLDVMICNAGFGVEGSADDITSELMRKLIDTNFLGTFYTARAALPVFRQQRSGHLIFVSSIVGKRGIGHMGAYSATKFAQVGLAESLRAELSGSNIHVSVVLPVSTDTEFVEVMQSESGSASRANGPRQTAEQVGESIARAIAHPAPEIYPYRTARGLALLNAIAPGFCDRFVSRFSRLRVTAAPPIQRG